MDRHLHGHPAGLPVPEPVGLPDKFHRKESTVKGQINGIGGSPACDGCSIRGGNDGQCLRVISAATRISVFTAARKQGKVWVVVSFGSGTGVPPVNGHGQHDRATANDTTTRVSMLLDTAPLRRYDAGQLRSLFRADLCEEAHNGCNQFTSCRSGYPGRWGGCGSLDASSTW